MGSRIVFIMVCSFFLAACEGKLWTVMTKRGGGDEIFVEDPRLFGVYRFEGSKHVEYAVETDGQCAIVDVYPFWQYNDTTETISLREYEDILGYGVRSLVVNGDGSAASFHIVALPEKTIDVALVVEESKQKPNEYHCRFEPYGTVDDQYSLVTEVRVKEEGVFGVEWLEIYGFIPPDFEKATYEKIKR